jgi:hypothetical protein
LKAQPDPESQTLSMLREDTVLPWLREVISARPSYVFNNQRWVETPEGFIYGAYLQPVENHPNIPVQSLPNSSRGLGMWAEITIPYVDARLEREASPIPGLAP